MGETSFCFAADSGALLKHRVRNYKHFYQRKTWTCTNTDLSRGQIYGDVRFFMRRQNRAVTPAIVGHRWVGRDVATKPSFLTSSL